MTNGGTSQWKTPELPLNTIHVWELPLLLPESLSFEFASVLSQDECERAARFHFERDARKFTVTRGSTRSILADYLRQTPRDLRFEYSQHGKPSLHDSSSDLRFSVSHSGDFALVAVSRELEIGVDIEKIREDIETDKLSERFFSQAERAAILSLAPERRIPSFFRCWTCKEAFLKAQGIGLSRSLDSFDVEVDPDQPARLLATRPNQSEAREWILYDVETPSGYAAALAVAGPVSEITILKAKT